MMTQRFRRYSSPVFLTGLLTVVATSIGFSPSAAADDDEAIILGQFVTIRGAVDDADIGRIQNIAERLHEEAVAGGEKRPAYLVLEVHSGSSRFGTVRDLAKILRSQKIANVTTVAWVPQTVEGVNAIIALACEEIIMAPEARLGNIGNGKPLDKVDRQFVMSLAESRHNRMLSEALVEGMVDPAVEVVRVEVTENDQKQSRLFTRDELATFERDNPTVGTAVLETVKNAGEEGTFSGKQGSVGGYLVVETAFNRGEVADIYNVPRNALREEDASDAIDKVRLIRIDEPLTEVLTSFIDRQIDRAAGSGSKLIVFEIDSSEGLLLPSFDLADQIAELREKEIRTVAWIPERARGGAAVIALACDEIYMAPDARIGDIASGGLDVDEETDEDIEPIAPEDVQRIRDKLVEIADSTGRPKGIVLAMLDADVEVQQATNLKTGRVSYLTADEVANNNGEWDIGGIVPETATGEPLLLEGDAAHRLQIAQSPVQDRDELKQRLGIPTDVDLRPIDRTWVDSVIFWLNTPLATFLLVVAGVVFIYLELHMMTGLLGIMAALCFIIFFWSRFLGGTAGWLEILLFIAGLVCLGLEFFVIPGFGVFGISGGLLLFVSLVMASQTFGNFEPDADTEKLSRTLGALSGSFVTVVVLALVMGRFLPKIPVLNKLVLVPPSLGYDPDGPMLHPDLSDGIAGMVGRRGRTISILRPAGKMEIEGELYDVVSDGPYIDQGTAVEVVKVSGNRVFVKEVASDV